MIVDELARQITVSFGFAPTAEQAAAVDVFCRFMTDTDDHAVMILRGSAGTGKTTLSSAIVKTLARLGRKLVLLAPTGRAAKVFSLNSGKRALTIHRKIYRQKTFAASGGCFNLNDNLAQDTLFIVDEASMIANDGMSDTMSFGTGRLLDDLVCYVYGGRNCRLMLVGDKAQLPPIGEDESPALMSAYMAGYGLKVYECDLTEVLRQAEGSGILYNATVVRRMITHDEMTLLPRITFSRFADIRMVPGDELIEQLAGSYSAVGEDETIVITRSNKRANIYNAGIRNMVLGREEELSTGDMLMVVKNNYYWLEREKQAIPVSPAGIEQAVGSGGQPSTRGDGGVGLFIANGDRAYVQRVRNVRELYGFRFADVWLQFPDYDDYELQVTMMVDTLTSEAPALTRQQNEQLFNAVLEDYQDVPRKADRIKRIREDMYYNALQVKFAYAVTCHKAQGGQWAHVYIDQGYMTDDMLTPDYIHWLYTAFTRATERLFLVNWPKAQTLFLADE